MVVVVVGVVMMMYTDVCFKCTYFVVVCIGSYVHLLLQNVSKYDFCNTSLRCNVTGTEISSNVGLLLFST